MKLKLLHDFELEVGNDKYTGTLKDLTKGEIKKIEKLTPTKELKELKKLQRKPEKNADRINELLDIIDDFDVDEVFKARLEKSIDSQFREQILVVGASYGYQRVFDTIMEDIADKKEGN